MLIWLIIILLLVVFAGVMLFGAPYLPTLNKQLTEALDLSGLKPGQTLIDLGCGDGRILIAAARRGVKCVGFELNPLLYLLAVIRTRRYRKLVKVVWGNYWQRDWPKADYIFVFLIERYMNKLNRRVEKYSHKPVKLISF